MKGAVTQWTKAYWDAVHPFDLGGAAMTIDQVASRQFHAVSPLPIR